MLDERENTTAGYHQSNHGGVTNNLQDRAHGGWYVLQWQVYVSGQGPCQRGGEIVPTFQQLIEHVRPRPDSRLFVRTHCKSCLRLSRAQIVPTLAT